MNNVVKNIINNGNEKINQFNCEFFSEYFDIGVLKNLVEIEDIYLKILENKNNCIDDSLLNLINDLINKLTNLNKIEVIKNAKIRDLGNTYNDYLRNLIGNNLVRDCYTNYIGLILKRRILYLYKTVSLSRNYIFKLKNANEKPEVTIEDEKVILNKQITDSVNIEINRFINDNLLASNNHEKKVESISIYLSNNIEIVNKIYEIIDNLEKYDDYLEIISTLKYKIDKDKREFLNVEVLKGKVVGLFKGNNSVDPRLMFHRLISVFSNSLKKLKKDIKHNSIKL